MARPTLKCAWEYGVAAERDGLIEATGVFTCHVSRSASADDFTIADQDDMLERLYSWWWVPGTGDEPPSVALRETVDCELSLLRVTVTPGYPLGDTRELFPDPDYAQGTRDVASMPYPPQCATVIGLRTATDTRQGRGRMYLPCSVEEAEIATGHVSPGRADSYGLVIALLASRVRGEPIDPVPAVLSVWSRVAGDAESVLHFEVASRLGTQRRRAVTPVGHRAYGLDGAHIP